MTDVPDADLLEQFATSESEESFAEIVRRHIGLVHSVALRHTSNRQHAEEITQAVFIILARKASSLSRKTVLSGWLYHTARLTAANFQRAEFRRIRREQEVFMQSTSNSEDIESAWRELCPLLEKAMARLGSSDRDAIVLRFFENKSLQEVGTALGVEERAAQKRVARGLEKLRAFFSKRGVALSATVIAAAASANSVQAAPAGFAAAVSATAVKGTTVATSTLTLVNGTLKLMAWAKAKLAIAITTAVVLAAGTVSVTTIALSPPFDPWQHIDSFSAEFGGILRKQMGSNNPDASVAENMETAKRRQKETDDFFRRFFNKSPVGVTIRQTHSPGNSASARQGDDLIIERSVPFTNLLAVAYHQQNDGWGQFSPARMILSADLPTEDFDFLVNVPKDGPKEFQDQIKKQFGLTGHVETLTTNVLALRLKNPDAPGLQPNAHVSIVGPSFFSASGLADHLERNVFHYPVIDETKLDETRSPGALSFTVPFKPGEPGSLKKLLLDEYGLELVSTNTPIDMLVVEKVKN